MTLAAVWRRQALPVHREAADFSDDVGASVLLRHPPHPPITKAPLDSGKPYEEGGRVIAFFYPGRRQRFFSTPNPGIAIIFCYYFLGLGRASGQLTIFKNPRNTAFIPLNERLFPLAHIFQFHPFFLLLFLFNRERNSRKGAKSGRKLASTKSEKNPRAFQMRTICNRGKLTKNQSKSWIGNCKNVNGDNDLRFSASNPRIAREKCPSPLEIGVSGGAHGGH